MSNEKRRYEMRTRAAKQEETRRRIAAATAQLHEEVGPLRTTVTEIARRAGVQRPTVYNNFPEERELFAACSAHFLAENPWPELGPLLDDDPEASLKRVLAALYAWYRATERTSGNVARDRRALPVLDELLRDTADARIGALAGALAARFGSRGRHVRAAVRLALDFWTWHRLNEEGLDDRAAARLMSRAVAASV